MWMSEQRGSVWIARPDTTAGVRIGPQDAWQALDEVLTKAPDAAWIIDTSRESVLTSDALTILVAILRRLQLSGGRMVFVRTQAGVANVLRSMRLARLIPMFDSIETATAHYASAQSVSA